MTAQSITLVLLDRWNQILKCFMRSVEQLNLRFLNFIGDGDSKAYDEVVKANPYGDCYPVNKGECLGHFQKRVGSRLRKLKRVWW